MDPTAWLLARLTYILAWLNVSYSSNRYQHQVPNTASSLEDINQSLGIKMITFNPFLLEKSVVHSDKRLTLMPSMDLPYCP